MQRLSENLREYLAACRASQKACDARAALPPGSSRARVTTLNARWANAAEERDRRAAFLTPEERAYADDERRRMKAVTP
jgi:hypothetical protein